MYILESIIMKKVATFSLVFILMLSTFICAQEDVSSEIVYNRGDISVDAGIDYVTKYFFRGLLVEDDGYIIQPYVQLNFHIVSGCDVEVTAFGGVWASLHGEDVTEQLAQNDPEALNELRLIGGLEFDLYDLLIVTGRYTIYTFPNQSDTGANDDRLEDRHEVSLGIRINDGPLLGGNFSINPFGLLALELYDGNPNVANEGDESFFALFGIEPTIAIALDKDANLLLSLPVTVGYGLANDTYVDNDNNASSYGFTSVGIKATVPLVFIPKRFGQWRFVAGLDAYFLGEAAEDTNDDEEFDLVANFGINMNY